VILPPTRKPGRALAAALALTGLLPALAAGGASPGGEMGDRMIAEAEGRVSRDGQRPDAYVELRPPS